MELYRRNKRLVSSITIFQEFIKEVAATLSVKEYVVDHMISAYEQAREEDTKLECAMVMF